MEPYGESHRGARPLACDGRVVAALKATRPQRFVGVHYLADDEKRRHYIDSNMPDQYDALIYVDKTAALEPLDDAATWDESRKRGRP